MESETLDIENLCDSAVRYRGELPELREIILANAVMCGEIPSPTFSESDLTRFLCDRFTESELDNIATDEAGNAIGVLKGSKKDHTILVAAHADKIWESSVDHTVTVSETAITGPGIADNALGTALLVSLPPILEKLGITLQSNLLLIGTTKSLGRGDLQGMRFFLENTKTPIDMGLCLEGMQLGRLSYSSLGMLRAEISVSAAEARHWHVPNTSGAIAALNIIVERILAIERPEKPRTAIILGSVQAGSAFSVPTQSALLRFEVRSEDAGVVDRIHEEIREIVNEANAIHDNIEAALSVVAQRIPGEIGFTHPLVKAARGIMESLDVKPRFAPSISELSALLDQGIPSLTLGITHGDNRNAPTESIQIDPLYAGVAQIVAVLQAMDQILSSEQDEQNQKQ